MTKIDGNKKEMVGQQPHQTQLRLVVDEIDVDGNRMDGNLHEPISISKAHNGLRSTQGKINNTMDRKTSIDRNIEYKYADEIAAVSSRLRPPKPNNDNKPTKMKHDQPTNTTDSKQSTKTPKPTQKTTTNQL